MCNLCAAVCGLVLRIDEGRVTGVRGNPADPLSRGHVCPKGVAIGDVHADPDRLRRPVRRVGHRWKEISWDQAFDLVAERIAATVNEHGDDALAVYLGNPHVHSLGALTHGLPVVQSLRTRNKFSATSVDQLPPDDGPPALRPPAAAAGPRHRPHLLLPRPRRQPDGLQRLAEGIDLGPLEPGQLPDRLFTRDKRIHLVPDLVVEDLVRLRAQELPGEEELVLIGRRHQRDCNSWLHNTDRLTRGRPRHRLLMHPTDLRARGLEDGAVVTVKSRVGAVRVEVEASEDMMPGVVSLPHGYGHRHDGVLLGVATRLPGVSVNDLTDPARLDVSGNAALSGVPVRVS